jgi:hypothetical protein
VQGISRALSEWSRGVRFPIGKMWRRNRLVREGTRGRAFATEAESELDDVRASRGLQKSQAGAMLYRST